MQIIYEPAGRARKWSKKMIREIIESCDAANRDEPFYLESATTVGGSVRFHVYNGRVQADGFADEVERGITTVDELVDYAWTERKRILD